MNLKPANSTNIQRNNGFTLVEVSIVLVVIGLLAGGILAAQTMMETARINAQTKQYQQIIISVSAFKSKFNYYPGDGINFTPAGNGDGLVSSAYGGPPAWTHNAFFDQERAQFWRQLQDNGFMSNQQPFATTLTDDYLMEGVHAPAAKTGFGGKNEHPILEPVTNESLGKNYILHCAANEGGGFQGVGSWHNVFSLTPKQALALDTKSDDGNPTNGTTQISSWAQGNGAPFLESSPALSNRGWSCFNSNSEYELSATTPTCCMMVELQ